MKHEPWLRIGVLEFSRMARATRAYHVRRHLLNGAERWWRICGASRGDLRLAGALFLDAGFGIGPAAGDDSDKGPYEGPLSVLGAELHDHVYSPIYHDVLRRMSAGGDAVKVQAAERADGEREVAVTAPGLGVRVIARGRRRLRVRTAYRPSPLVEADDDALVQRTCVRFARFAASILRDAPDGGEEER